MKNLSLIVAVGKNMEIGKDNKLLWHIPEDLKFFKEKTSGKTIIMGSNTFYSLPKLLPNRHHIVLTLDDYKFPDEVEVYYDFNTLLKALETRDEEMFIIGGAAIYSLFIAIIMSFAEYPQLINSYYSWYSNLYCIDFSISCYIHIFILTSSF